ncbi:MAG: YidC/Oxa1 family membrane protein insertase [Clostridia bacterium]|nr:YidC/Oxa1 family membrane protein insertase [Clostridia bacterium]
MESLYQILGIPFGWLLYALFRMGIHNYAALIVIITLVTRIIMIPSSIAQQKGMAKTQRIQSKIRKIQQKYAGDQKKIQEETQNLYQREGYNPMGSGCAPMVVQFILLFGLIGVIYYPLSNFLHISEAEVAALKEAVKALGASVKFDRLLELEVFKHIDTLAENGVKGVSPETLALIKQVGFKIGPISLGDVPKENGVGIIWIIPVLSFLSTIGSSIYSMIKQKQSGTGGGQMGKSMGCMTVFMAAISLMFVVQYPVGIGVYWIASSVFALISSVIIGQIYTPKKMLAKLMVDETIERRSRENNIKFAVNNKEEK